MGEIVVSVAISCYNFEAYIEECITSILSQQTQFNFEIIVVDDASTDRSSSIIQKYADNNPIITFIKQSKNQGSDSTKQLACKLAKGKYIAFLDGDDVALPGKLQSQYDYLEANPDCSCCYHDVNLIDKNSENLGTTFFSRFYNRDYIPEKATMEHLVQYGTFLAASSQMFVKDAFKINLLPANIKYIQDFYYHIHTSSKGTIGRINKVLGAYRQHSESYSGLNAKSNQRRLQCLHDILAACDYALTLGCDETIVSKGKMHYHYAAALYFAKKGEHELFSKLIQQSSDGKYFFDLKHKSIYELAQQNITSALEYIHSNIFSNSKQEH